MNAVFYNSIKGKRINGTLFYSFEYFVFLKQFINDIEFLIADTDVEYFKAIFKEKYNFDHKLLDDIKPITKIGFTQLDIDNLLVLDMQSYNAIRDLAFNVKTVNVYSTQSHSFLDTKPNHRFYGWYNYQTFNKRTRLKFYLDIHKTFETKGNKTFVSYLNGDGVQILSDLNLDPDTVYTKRLNQHNENLFANVDKIVYYHTGHLDTNNRIVVESYIHNIPLEIHFNGHTNDSIFERATELDHNGLDQFAMTQDDVMIRDFLDGCSCLCE